MTKVTIKLKENHRDEQVSCFLSVWLITWDVSQHLHGCHELLAGLLILAVLIEQAAHVVDVVRVVRRQLLQQQLSAQRDRERVSGEKITEQNGC